jgi:16S rRNA processing protein RimM
MGRIVAPYGVQGWVRVSPMTAERDTLLAHRRWWVRAYRGDGPWQEHVLESGKAHGAALLVRLSGLVDREAAALLNGAEVGVPRSALPAPAENEYYLADLVGLEVVNRQGERLGQVAAVEEFGAHPVLRVTDAAGVSRRIPMVDAYVDGIDPVGRRIEVDWQLDY